MQGQGRVWGPWRGFRRVKVEGSWRGGTGGGWLYRIASEGGGETVLQCEGGVLTRGSAAGMLLAVGSGMT